MFAQYRHNAIHLSFLGRLIATVVILAFLSASIFALPAQADTPAPNTVSIHSDKVNFDAGTYFELSARTNFPFKYSHNRQVHIVEAATEKVLRSCYSECSYVGNFSSGDSTREYFAVLSSRGDIAYPDTYDEITGIIHTSNPVTVSRSPWLISLETDKEVFQVGEYANLTARVNQDLPTLGNDYMIYIFDITTNERIGSCPSLIEGNRECTIRTRFLEGDAHDYQAFVALNPPRAGYFETIEELEDKQATSEIVQVARARWEIQQVESSQANVALFKLNQNLTDSHPHAAYIVDDTTNKVLKKCTRDTACSIDLRPENRDSPLTAYVAYSLGVSPSYYKDIINIEADSKGYIYSNIDNGMVEAERWGGWNPSQLCGQPCIADPVNSVTGEYYENHSDFIVPSSGLSLLFQRNYGVSQRVNDGPLGYGWSHSYDLKLVHDSTASSLTDSKSLTVVQENGSRSTFYKDNTGQYITPNRNIARLSYSDEKEEYSFERLRTKTTYVFNTEGKLLRIQDRNGSTVTASYNNEGLLSGVYTNKNTSLEFAYNASDRITDVVDQDGRAATYEYSPAGNLVKATNYLGQVNEYTYDNNHAILTFSNTLGGVTTNTYSSNYKIRQQVDPEGGKWDFSFSVSRSTITDPAGRKIQYNFSNGRVTSRIDGYGTTDAATTSFTYDSTNSITSITDPLGNVTSMTYDSMGNMLTEISPEGRVMSYDYDDEGNLLSTSRGDQVETRTYTAEGNLTEVNSPEGNKTSYAYNSDGTVSVKTSPRGNASSNPDEFKTAFVYNERGLLEQTISPMGIQENTSLNSMGKISTLYDPRYPDSISGATAVEYSHVGEVASITDPLGNTQSFNYDPMGNLLSETNTLGHTYSYDYNDMGQKVSETDERGHTTNYSLTKNGEVRSITMPNNGTISYEHDARGNIVKEIDAEGGIITKEYDKNDRVVKETLQDGKSTLYDYDKDGLLVKETNADSSFVTYSYDETGQLVAQRDEEGKLTQFEYSLDGLLTNVVHPDSSAVQMTYDENANMINRVNEQGQTESWAYDADDRRISYANVAGQETLYEYDNAGNVTNITRPDGSVVFSSYDELSQVSEIAYPGESATLYEYDPLGRVLEQTKGDSSSSFEYDETSNVTSVVTDGKEIEYHYSEMALVESLRYEGLNVGYRYDLNGNLSAISSPSLPDDFLMDRTPWGATKNIAYPNGVVTNYEYNDRRQVRGINAENSANATIIHEAYDYNQSNLLAKQDSSLQDRNYEYSYDSKDRLTGANTDEYSYSPAGYLTEISGSTVINNALGAPLVVNHPDRNRTRYDYDLLGNRTMKTNQEGIAQDYGWSPSGSLGHVDGVSYQYDTTGLLSQRSSEDEDDELLWTPVPDIPLLLSDSEYNYIYGNSYSPVAQINKVTGEVEYLHSDGIDSVIAITDGQGRKVYDTSFTPYGDGEPISAFGFAGGWTDDKTDLIYFRARWYDPENGSFISIDPLIETTHQPYLYAGSNPIKYVDPLGLMFVNGGDVHEWFNNASTAEKLDAASMLLGTISLVSLFTPVGPVVAPLTGGGAAVLSGFAAGYHIQDGNYASAVFSGIGSLPGVASVGYGAKMGTLQLKQTRATFKALREGKPVPLTRNPVGSENIRRIKKNVDLFSEMGITPLPYVALITCTFFNSSNSSLSAGNSSPIFNSSAFMMEVMFK